MVRTGTDRRLYLVILVLALVGGVTLRAETQPGKPLPSVAQRVAQLEKRVRELDRRVAVLEAAQRAKKPEAPVAVKRFPSPTNCDPPFEVDAAGIKKIKAGCEEQKGADNCDPPYDVSASGTRTVRPECEAKAVPAGDCDPPFTVDASGRKVVRRECLSN